MKNKRVPYKTTMYYTDKSGKRIDLGTLEWKMGLPVDDHGTFSQTLMYKQRMEIEDMLVTDLIQFDHKETK